jgi:signal transduction histidine kinase
VKKLVSKNTRLLRRAGWLIRHRWYAIGIVIGLLVLGELLLLENLNSSGILLVVICLGVENVLCLLHLKKIKFIRDRKQQYKLTKRNINFQITTDIIVLTILIHFTGGIESPFIAAYYFHMVIASILLSYKETFIQTSIAISLLVLLTYFEYRGFIQHYCVSYKSIDVSNPMLYSDTFNYFKTLIAFIVSFYTLSYIAAAIGKRLRTQEEQYTDAIKLLNKKDRIQNEYVLRLTHDIKGHISAIQSSISVVKKGIFEKLSEKNQDFIDIAYKRTLSLTRFIKDLLRLTKMRQSRDFKKHLFSFREMLTESLDHVKSHCEYKAIKLDHTIDPQIDMIQADEFSLKEITVNMMLNAVKYTPENGYIKLEAFDFVDFIRVSISDSGMGIPEKEISLIFDEFYRGSNVDTKAIEGTGVGLAIAKNVILQHNGEIWAENNENGGARFIFEIPKQIDEN